jgi:hypothetical protein
MYTSFELRGSGRGLRVKVVWFGVPGEGFRSICSGLRVKGFGFYGLRLRIKGKKGKG